jgi:hypothetical protein
MGKEGDEAIASLVDNSWYDIITVINVRKDSLVSSDAVQFRTT